MRTDMFKVIVERPRWGAGHAASPKLKRTKDYTLKTIGHKRHAIESTRYTKGFNENLAPLVRFLRSRCGQRWDDVFSEICAQLDTGSTMKMHVRQHIEDFVLARISTGRYGEWLFEGEILGSNERRYRRRQFFVDPTDGVLKEQRFLSACLPVENRIMGAAHYE